MTPSLLKRAVFAACVIAILAGGATTRAAQVVPVPDDVELFRDVVFGTGGGRELKMHIARPKPAPETPLPAIVYIHGGAWMGGDKEESLPGILADAQRGYVAASIEYRLSGEAIFPAQIQDCKCAIRFLRAHAEQYGLDPDRIGVRGGSAGGHLAALVGTSGDEDVYHTEILGQSQTQQWFPLFSLRNWQARIQTGSGVNRWFDPEFSIWSNDVRAGASPEVPQDQITRVVITIGMTDNGETLHDNLEQTIATVRAKYPALKQIVLQPLAAGPNEAISEVDGQTVRSARNLAAIKAAIAEFAGGDIVAGPIPTVAEDSQFRDGVGHLTREGSAHVARQLEAYWRANNALEGDGGWPEHSSRVQAVCDYFGPTDFLHFESAIPNPDSAPARLVGGPLLDNKEKVAMANPIAYVDPDDPPFYIAHGTADPLVPIIQSEMMHEALTAAGVESTFYQVEGGQHGGFNDPELNAAVIAFFEKHLKGEAE